MKLFLAVSANPGYIDFLKDRKLREWQLEKPKLVEGLNRIGATALFGNISPYWMDISDKASATKLAKDLQAVGSERLAKKLKDSGLVICCSVDLVGSRELQKVVKELGGEVDARRKDDRSPFEDEVFEGVEVSREVRKYILDWAGQDRAKPLGVLNWLRTLSPERQRRVTIDQIAIQLVGNEGELAPFLEEQIFKGNYIEAVSIARRSNAMPIIANLKTKLAKIYKVAALRESGLNLSGAELQAAVGHVGKGFYYVERDAKRFSFEQAEKMLKLVIDFEGKVKSGRVVNVDDSLEVFLIRLSFLATSKG